MLEQEQIDVKNKLRANIFNWRGQFTPQLVEYLLKQYADSNSVILDVFSGSGTVLSEASARGMEAYGFEINPSAYYMSSFFELTNYSVGERKEVFEDVKKLLSKHQSFQEPLFDPTDQLDNLSGDIFQLFQQEGLSHMQKIVLVNVLIKASDFEKKYKGRGVVKAHHYLLKHATSFERSSQKIQCFLKDARQAGDIITNKATLTISSPPYINVFNYHQNYRPVVEALKFDVLDIAKSEFGSNRKNRGNRFKTVIQYCIDMEEALYSIAKATVQGGKIILVIGRESRVRNVPFLNSKLVQDIADASGYLSSLNSASRSFQNKFGSNIIEDVLVLEKSANEVATNNARAIAKEALIEAMVSGGNDYADDIIRELNGAIQYVHTATASPFPTY